MTPRLGAAIRFAVVIAAVNLSALGLFSSGSATTSATFATISALYFLDYDGSVRERVGAYASATAVGVAGMLIGVVVQGSLVATIATAFIIGFVFAAARAYRGFIARSFVGAQLAFVLAVFTEHAPTHVAGLLEGWLWGSALSLVGAVLIFPRHHAGTLRKALAEWCRAVAGYIRADQPRRPGALVEVRRCEDQLARVDRGEAIAGLWSKRMRSLASMRLHVTQVSEFLALVPPLADITADQADLARTTADGFDAAAAMVPLDGTTVAFAPVLDARMREFESERARTDSDDANHFDLRVLSIAGESVQVLAAASQGWEHPDWPLIVEPEHSLPSLIRRTFSTDSIWLYHGLRTGVALAGAIAVASIVGLEHGVWVVMAALSVINVTFTTSSSSRTAVDAIIGVLGGIAISAGLIAVAPQWWMLALAVPVLALLAKFMLPANGILAQLTYTPFAVANIVMLGWPTPHGLNIIRAEDITVGALVAVAATALTFPFGMRRLVDMVWNHARSAAEVALSATRTALEHGTVVPPHLAKEQSLAFASSTDVVDTIYAGGARLGDRMDLVTSRQSWLNLAMLCQIGVAQLAEMRRTLPDGDPGIRVLTRWADDAFATLRRADPE